MYRKYKGLTKEKMFRMVGKNGKRVKWGLERELKIFELKY